MSIPLKFAAMSHEAQLGLISSASQTAMVQRRVADLVLLKAVEEFQKEWM